MKPSLTLGTVAALSLLLLSCQADLTKNTDSSAPSVVLAPNTSSLTLTSSAFEPNGSIPAAYSCDGAGVSPPLAIRGVPTYAKSLVLFIADPSASPSLFFHWVLWNMVPQDQDLPEGVSVDVSQLGATSAGNGTYVPLCPENTAHMYHFVLFALDTRLQFDTPPTAPQLQDAMQGHIITQTELAGSYKRATP